MVVRTTERTKPSFQVIGTQILFDGPFWKERVKLSGLLPRAQMNGVANQVTSFKIVSYNSGLFARSQRDFAVICMIAL